VTPLVPEEVDKMLTKFCELLAALQLQ